MGLDMITIIPLVCGLDFLIATSKTMLRSLGLDTQESVQLVHVAREKLRLEISMSAMEQADAATSVMERTPESEADVAELRLRLRQRA